MNGATIPHERHRFAMMLRMTSVPTDAQLIGEGFGSKVYMTSQGQIVRVAKNQLTQEKHQREVVILRVLKRYVHSVAIPLPTIIIESSPELPYGAVGYDRIVGKPLQAEDIMPTRQGLFADQIAQFIAELHQVPLEEIVKITHLPAYLPSPIDLEELWARVGTYIRDHDSPLLPAIQTALTASIDTATRAEQYPVLIHGDLWYENMIFDGNRIVGIIDFEAVSAGPAIVDFMTQGYAGDSFRRAMVSAFQKYATFDYDETLGKGLMFLRELQGLDYGIRAQDVDDDVLAKIAAAASEL